jgi:hypothetical protein
VTLSPALIASLFIVLGAILLGSTIGLVLSVRDWRAHRRRRPHP